ncbi:hypothetical protein CMT84_06365 [Elizabethkingia anophelis]|nr:hypothetical protein [Elizabethkingia anophelis]
MRTNINKNLILGVVILSIISCSSRDDSPKNSKSNNGITGTYLRFNIAGIEEKDNVTNFAKSSVNKNDNSYVVPALSIANDKMVSAGGFDVLIKGEQELYTNKIQNIASSSVQGNLISATTQSPMANGIKYRLLIYDAINNTLVKNVDATSGINLNIQVDGGKQYKWYAVSTNDNITPNADPATGIINGNTLMNKDVLWNQGVVDAQYGENNMNVVFKRNTSQINVDLDVRGMFGIINNTTSLEIGSGTGTNFSTIIQTGDLNIFTGQYSNFQNAPAITGANMINKTGSGGALGGTKTATFYTVSTTSIPINNLRVRLNQLDINLDDNSIRSFPSSIIPFNNSLVTTVLGNRYSLNLRLLESGVISKTGRPLKWARTDLRYNASQNDKYRFVIINSGNNMTSDSTNDYWNWMSATPTGPSTDNVDPCSKVYPEGIWRMPTSSEYDDLVSDVNTGYFGWNYYFYGSGVYGADFPYNDNPNASNPSNNSYPTNSQKLILPYAGYRNNSDGSLSNSYTFPIPLVYRQGYLYYWTSTPTDALKSKGFYAYYSLTFVVQNYGASIVDGNKINEGYRIRCVRTVSN